jgi:hemerythrin-like domain-containing protein
MDRDAIKVLDDEHDGLQVLFGRVSGEDEDRPAVLKQLLQALSLHVSMEKQMLVPVVKDRLSDGDAVAEQLADYHDEVGRIHVLLDRRKANSPDVPELVTQLLDLTERHVAEASSTLLPALRDALNETELAELGAAMVSDERQLLTHPHPHLPDRGPFKKVGRWAASVVDKERDRSTDVGRASS